MPTGNNPIVNNTSKIQMMKIKFLFLSSLFTLSLASCDSNEDSFKNNTHTAFEGDLRLKVDIASLTRAQDVVVAQNAKSNINTVDIYLLDETKVYSSYNIDEQGLKDLTSEKGFILGKINGNISRVALIVNKNNSEDRIPSGTPNSEIKKIALKTKIKEIQPKEQEGHTGVANAQMFGESPIIDSSAGINELTGNNVFTATVNLKPSIARIQVYGEIKHSSEISDFKVKKIFLDNLLTERGDSNSKLNVNTATGEALKSLLNQVGIFDMSDNELTMFPSTANRAYAYHIFPQQADNTLTVKPKDKSVKLIIELEYKDAENVTTIEYATLRLAKANTTSPTVVDPSALNIEESEVYTMDLGVIDWTGDGKYVDPSKPDVEDEEKDEFKPGDGGTTPNANQRDLSIITELQTWTDVAIIPQN